MNVSLQPVADRRSNLDPALTGRGKVGGRHQLSQIQLLMHVVELSPSSSASQQLHSDTATLMSASHRKLEEQCIVSHYICTRPSHTVAMSQCVTLKNT